jgi:hypothetical protein
LISLQVTDLIGGYLVFGVIAFILEKAEVTEVTEVSE